MKRTVPDINIGGIKGYAVPLAQNFDSVQECFSLLMPSDVELLLQQGKDYSNDVYDGEQQITIPFGGEYFQVWSGGAQGGIKWVIENDDLEIFFKKPISSKGKIRTWTVSVRYLSGGLWEHGFDALKKRALNILFNEGFQPLDISGKVLEDYSNFNQWQRISRVDYAFDFHSVAFSHEMTIPEKIINGLVLPSGVKYGVVGSSTEMQTLTIGMSRPSLQLQVYNKGKEITEKSGKYWMVKIWERNGYKLPDDGKIKDVWRLEIRFGKEFLKNRKIQTFDEFNEKLQELLCEALFKRRLSTIDNKYHKERWGLHPLFAECYKQTEMVGQYAPIGRQQTLRGEELIKVMQKQQSGLSRSICVLKTGTYDHDTVCHDLEQIGVKNLKDPDHYKKVEKAMERYKFTDEAK